MNTCFSFSSPRKTALPSISISLLRKTWKDLASVACSRGQFNSTSRQWLSFWPCFILPNPSLLHPGITSQLNHLHAGLCLRLLGIARLTKAAMASGLNYLEVSCSCIKSTVSTRIRVLKNMESNFVVMCLCLSL
jgi:hypothetical protein